MTRYIWHYTVSTGHGRRSARSEASDAAVTICKLQIAEALRDQTPYVQPDYRLKASAAGGALLATLMAGDRSVVTAAVCRKSRDSARLWAMIGQNGAPPAPPWLAAIIHTDDPAILWAGDWERCVAWAWIEGVS